MHPHMMGMHKNIKAVNRNETNVIINHHLAFLHFICRVTLFFTYNSLEFGSQITMEFLHNFLDPAVIFSSLTMFINASTKEFTLIATFSDLAFHIHILE